MIVCDHLEDWASQAENSTVRELRGFSKYSAKIGPPFPDRGRVAGSGREQWRAVAGQTHAGLGVKIADHRITDAAAQTPVPPRQLGFESVRAGRRGETCLSGRLRARPLWPI
jgi:hypothetical protein